MIEVSGLQIHEDEPITYKFASIDDFMQKMINKEIQTYKPIKMITVPANDKIIDKINQVIYYYYENIVKYVFEKNDYNLYSITVAMYAPEDYSNEALRRIVFNENEGENQSSYAKVKKIGDSDYLVRKIYYENFDQTKFEVRTIINDSYLLYVDFMSMNGNIDFNDSMIKDIEMENINI